MDDIAPAPDRQQLLQEVRILLEENVILRASRYALLVCNLEGRTALKQELGRLREITFREVGESTGKSLDLDQYDEYYEQLIIWDTVDDRLAGGYRFGCGDRIYAAYGKEGFYINSFFEIDSAFEKYLPYCLELGRSFIIAEYQKRNLPLYLLWKGILAYQIKHPQYHYLIGPVSISRFYSDLSRKMLMDFGMRFLMHPTFASYFKPRLPFDPEINLEDQQGLESFPDLSQLNFESIIEQISPEHIRFPVLMKQYIRQNARFLGFNLDPNFNNALDGLMILDVAEVPEQTLEMLQRE